MEEEKRKKIEAEFRKLLKFADKPQEKRPPRTTLIKGVRVIRRRKGSPDLQIA